MKEFEIPINMIDIARIKAKDMGALRNSLLKGGGNIAGFLGEQIALEYLNGEWTNTYDYDIILQNGMKVDVKTKQTTVTPLPHYACSVAKLNTKQKCDAYAFVRVTKDFTKGWYLGIITKDF